MGAGKHMKVLVIGGGPGGYAASVSLAQKGADVVLVEGRAVGGTCLNEGCIPTKTYLHLTNLYHKLSAAETPLSISTKDVTFSWKAARDEKNRIVQELMLGMQGVLARHNVTVVDSFAKFTSPNSVRISQNGEDADIFFDRAILAVGAEPVVLPIAGAESSHVLNSREVLDLEELPESVCIVGGGVIGCELATMLSDLEVEVYLLEKEENLLQGFDSRTVSLLRKEFNQRGITVLTNAQIRAFEDIPGGVRVCMQDEELITEKVFMLAGRRPNVRDLCLEKAGISLKDGAIQTNETFQTEVEHIYAIGDCTSRIQLAHMATAQGHFVAEVLTKGSSDVNLSVVPSCVYTTPELAKVGLTEEEALSLGYNAKTVSLSFAANARATAYRCKNGIVRMVYELGSKKILGIHLACEMASELISEAATLIRTQTTISDIQNSIYAHPSFSEIFLDCANQVE